MSDEKTPEQINAEKASKRKALAEKYAKFETKTLKSKDDLPELPKVRYTYPDETGNLVVRVAIYGFAPLPEDMRNAQILAKKKAKIKKLQDEVKAAEK